MKKKILVGLATIIIAVTLTFNLSIAKNMHGSNVDLSMLISTASAQAEGESVCMRAPNHYCNYNGIILVGFISVSL